jgi:hypothetical protein
MRAFSCGTVIELLKKILIMSKDKAPGVCVEFENDSWVVHNEGDSAILFTAPEKELAVKFATDMAQNHNIDLIVKDDEEDIYEEPEITEPCVCVEPDGDEWVVYNEGDSAVLFSAREKEDAVKFATEMSKQHEIKLRIADDGDAPQRADKEEALRVNVEHRDGMWVVKNDGDSAILFSSEDKDPALKFAQQMAEKHEIDLHVDRG